MIEHPAYASSWKTQAAEWLEAQEGVIRFEFDQCMTGLKLTSEQRTPRWSGIGEEEDDEDLEDALAREEQARERIEEPGRRLEVRDPPGGGGDEIETRHLAPGEDPGAPRDEGHVCLTDAQVKEIHRIHINTEHLPSRQMMILLKREQRGMF